MRSLSFKISIFFLVITGAAIFAMGQRPVPRNFSLQVNGQIRFAGSRAPAEGVLVSIESFTGGLVSQIITDRTGKFSFSGLNPVQYEVRAHLPGYLDVRERVDLSTANTGYLNIELSVDRNAVGTVNRVPGGKHDLLIPGVINTAIPITAQDELAKGKSDLASNRSEASAAAAGHFEKAVAIYPDYLEAQLMLGLARMDLGQWEKAEKPLREAIRINPQASTAFFALGEAYRRQKKYKEAETVLADGLKIADDSAPGHLTLAKVLWEKAPTSENEAKFRATAQSAWAEVSRALKLAPNLGEAHLLAGNMLLRAGREADAIQHFETYLKLEPKGEFADATRAVIKKLKEKKN